MESKEKLIELLKKQVAVEKTNVKEVGETEKKVGFAAAKLFLNIIRLDSRKHMEILNGIMQVLDGIPPGKTLWEHQVDSYIDPFVVQRELENHMSREAEMIKHVEKEIKQTQDEGLKLLLQHIANDEKKHHEILESVTNHLHRVNP